MTGYPGLILRDMSPGRSLVIEIVAKDQQDEDQEDDKGHVHVFTKNT